MAQITLLTGPERRRRWSEDERRRILAAAFAPGAVVSHIARQFEVSTSLIYKWREQTVAGEADTAFAQAVLAAEPPSTTPAPETSAIIVELANGIRLKIGVHATAALLTATLRALR
jgi:transposase